MPPKSRAWIKEAAWILAAPSLALLLTVLVALPTGAPPLTTLSVLIMGGLGSWSKFGQVLTVFVPLLLCSAGLLVPFTARLWNIGIEGQVVLGAIFATGALMPVAEGGSAHVALALAAGMLGGALWAMVSGLLKTWGRVHEIFSGLGLNFVAMGLTIWLIFGPWKRPGVASMSGTETLHASLWLDRIGNLAASWTALTLAAVALVGIGILLRRTRWGLRLKAVGQNPKAARLFDLSPRSRMLQAFALCGALGGLAGAVQVLGVYHRLLPSISSGYGYTALMVGMMAAYRVTFVPFICLFFAILNVGSIQLPLQLNLDSSLSGVIQGLMVLSVFVTQGLKAWMLRRREGC
jgi:ABC-type uncharacterized transport system permease subunit